ncbi:MAG: hypothetical protein AAFN09_09575 [Pseudomonadota bacterium]
MTHVATKTTIGLALIALTGCVSASEMAQRAEQVSATVIARLYPGMSTAPAANCVRDNATEAELRTLAGSSGAVGSDAQIVVLGILDRPTTITCLSDNGITLL